MRCVRHGVMVFSLLRDYLEMELETQLPRSFRLNIERAIDDFVLFCMIAGNDFLPGTISLFSERAIV